MTNSACRHCDRTDDEVPSCPSANACACSALQINRLIAGLRKQAEAWEKKLAKSTNYVANKEVNPTRVTFANGRTVHIKNGALVVGWKKESKND